MRIHASCGGPLTASGPPSCHAPLTYVPPSVPRRLSSFALHLTPADLPHDTAMHASASLHVVSDAARHVSSYLSSTFQMSHASASALSTSTIDAGDTLAQNLEHGLEAVENVVGQSIESVMAQDADLYADLTPELEEMSLDVLGHDLLLFLAASVVVEPLSRVLNLAPVLLYLILGFIAGPHGMSLFLGGTEVDAQIGDFGILFLLFVEGLNLSPERLKALGSFFSLGATQLLLSVGVIFFLFFLGGPMLLPYLQDVRVPIDDKMFSLLDQPIIAFSVAAAGALSSSAFVLPILKEKGWEKGPDGIAALSILLLQDLAVAPLLVILPLLADYDKGGGGMDTNSLTILVAKATVGFGGVLVIASQLLRRIFQIVASYGSSQTFVAASLLVACGMGIVAEDLGLSATTGAFAAGVLLAESGYRAQIEADIKPFEGILLGVFFVTAGASLDPQTVITEWPTLLAGIAAFLAIKFSVIFSAGEFALGLTRADAARVGLLLAGGGEFAFVIFKLAEDLGVIPENLVKLLTASVIISMSLTPLLGELAEYVGVKFEDLAASDMAKQNWADDYDINLTDDKRIQEAFEMFDEDGSGAISAQELQNILTRPGTSDEKLSIEEIESIIARYDDNSDGELQYEEFARLWTAKRRGALGSAFNDDSEKKSTSEMEDGNFGLENAIVICGYGEVGQRLCAALEAEWQGSETRSKPRYIAFCQDPARISAGVINGATVVYGDGANPDLVKAAGVEKPASLVITYRSETKAVNAVRRLRRVFKNTPIFARTSRQSQVRALMDAGATSVVIEKNQVAEGMCNLIGVSRGTITAQSLLDAVPPLIWEEEDPAKTLPYTDSELTQLANECGKTNDEMIELFKLFSTSFNRQEEGGKVQLAELRNELMREGKPMSDDELSNWMGYDEVLSKWKTGSAEEQWVSFDEFVRFASRWTSGKVAPEEKEGSYLNGDLAKSEPLNKSETG